MSFRDVVDRAKRYAGFSKVEKREFWIAALILGIVASWNQWGTVEFDVWVGFGNLLVAFLIALVTLYVHHMAQRVWGANKGIQVEHKVWWYGAGLAFLVTILSNGNFGLLAVSGTYISIITVHRLGRYRYGPQVKDYAMIALMGPVANIVLAGILKSIDLYIVPLPFVDQFFVFSLAFAAWNLLPIPPLDGSRIIFSSRLLYALVAGAVIGYVLLIQLVGVFSWLWALAIGLATWLIFYITLERSWK